MDPSPTADATRLTLPARTSPTAKTPGKPGPAYENLDTARRRSEKDGRLPGRIGAADDDHVFRFAELRLHVGRTVIDAQPLEPGKVGQRQLPVLHAGGDDQRARLDRSTR